jgi:hypothetical protein
MGAERLSLVFHGAAHDVPEALIKGKEDYAMAKKRTKMGIGKGGFSEETGREYAGCPAATIRRIRFSSGERLGTRETVSFALMRLDFTSPVSASPP